MRGVNASAAHKLCGAPGSLAGTPGPFLLVGLCTATGNFAAYLGLMRAKTRIGHLANISLVHQIYINGGFEYRRGEFNLAKLLAFQI
jgi:hypothetical protein